jgi:hypothetical protein
MRESFPSFRRKLFILVLCACLPCLCAFVWESRFPDVTEASTKDLDIAGLEIPEPTIDLGTVWSSGEGIRRQFLIINRTGRAIKIVSLGSDCGCTVPKANFSEVQNGQSTNIVVDFWPPASASSESLKFRRTISAIFSSEKGTETVPLTLTGFLAPDASLRVSPESVEIDGAPAGPGPLAVLHFKGSARLLANVPDRLLVEPGVPQRILIGDPRFDQVETVGDKDVTLSVATDPGSPASEDWHTSITFAPDSSSEGLTLHVHVRKSHLLQASPQSLVLADTDTADQATIQLTITSRIGPISFKTSTTLPVKCKVSDLLGKSGFYSLSVRMNGPLAADTNGIIRVTAIAAQPSPLSESIAIPVVILHCVRPVQKTTAATLHPGGLS